MNFSSAKDTVKREKKRVTTSEKVFDIYLTKVLYQNILT